MLISGGPLFARLEEADQNPQIICRDDPQEAVLILHNWTSPHEGIIENQEITQRSMPWETEKPPLTMIDEKPTDGTSTCKKDQHGHGTMKFENF